MEHQTRENRSTRVKTCPSATLSTTNPTWTDPGSNPGLRGERQATNRLSHGTVKIDVSIPIDAILLPLAAPSLLFTALVKLMLLLLLWLQAFACSSTAAMKT
jgi:hypothetical protein